MRRLLLVAVVLVGFGAVAADDASAKVKVKRHRWKCTFVGRMVFCDLVDKPLSLARPKDAVRLLERTTPEFSPLVTAPASFH